MALENAVTLYGELKLNTTSLNKLRSGYQQAQQWMNSHPLEPRMETRHISEPLGRITGQVSEFSKSMDAATARIFAFGASMAILRQASLSLQAIVQDTVKVQSTFVELNSLLGVGATSLKNYGKELFDIAKNTKRTFEEVAEAALELARQGLSASESLQRLNDAMVLSRVSGLDAAASVNALTAAINGFAKSAITSTEVVDKMLAVDTAFAVSSADLAEAIGRAGSVAQDVSVSYEQLLGMTAALQQTTARGGAVIGTALKSIFSRIERTDTLDRLESLGISVRNVSGEMKPAADVLQNLARAYDQFGEVDKVDIAQKIGGLRQINILKALFRDLGSEVSLYQKSLEISALASGDAARRNDALNESLDSLVNKLQISAKELSSTFGQDIFGGFFKSGLTFADDIVSLLNNILDSSGVGSNFGEKIADNILAVLKNFFSGPVVAIALGAIIRLGQLTVTYVAGALRQILQVNKSAQDLFNIETGIIGLLSQDADLRAVLVSDAVSLESKHRLVGELIKKENANLLRQGVIIKSIASEMLRINPNIGYSRGRFISGKQDAPLLPVFAKNTHESALQEAIEREVKAGAPRSQIYLDRDYRVRTPENPLGLLIANRRDEPVDGSQGVERYIKQGLNPKKAGIVPSFALNFGGGMERDMSGYQGSPANARYIHADSLSGVSSELSKQIGQSINNLTKNIRLPAAFESETIHPERIGLEKGQLANYADAQVEAMKLFTNILISNGNRLGPALKAFDEATLLATQENQEFAKVVGQLKNRLEGLNKRVSVTGETWTKNARDTQVFAKDPMFEAQYKHLDPRQKTIRMATSFREGKAQYQTFPSSQIGFGEGQVAPRITKHRTLKSGKTTPYSAALTEPQYFSNIVHPFRQTVAADVATTNLTSQLDLGRTGDRGFYASSQNTNAIVSKTFVKNLEKSGGDLTAAVDKTKIELRFLTERFKTVKNSMAFLEKEIGTAVGENIATGKRVSNVIRDRSLLQRSGFEVPEINKALGVGTRKTGNETNLQDQFKNIFRQTGGNTAQSIRILEKTNEVEASKNPEFLSKQREFTDKIEILNSQVEFTKKGFVEVEQKMRILGKSNVNDSLVSSMGKTINSQKALVIKQNKVAAEYSALQSEIEKTKFGFFSERLFKSKAKALTDKVAASGQSDVQKALLTGVINDKRKEQINPFRFRNTLGLGIGASMAGGVITQNFGDSQAGAAAGAGLQAGGSGALLASSVGIGGPWTIAIAAILGGVFFGLKAGIEAGVKSLEEVSDEVGKVNEKFASGAEGASRYVDAQNRLNEAIKEGAGPEVLEKFRESLQNALVSIDDTSLRLQLFAAGNGASKESGDSLRDIVKKAQGEQRSKSAIGQIRTTLADQKGSFNKNVFEQAILGGGRFLKSESENFIAQQFSLAINELDEKKVKEFKSLLESFDSFTPENLTVALKALGVGGGVVDEILKTSGLNLNLFGGSIVDATDKVIEIREVMANIANQAEQTQFALSRVQKITDGATKALFAFRDSMQSVEQLALKINQTIQSTLVQDTLKGGSGSGAATGLDSFISGVENAIVTANEQKNKLISADLGILIKSLSEKTNDFSQKLVQELQGKDFGRELNPETLLKNLQGFAERLKPDILTGKTFGNKPQTVGDLIGNEEFDRTKTALDGLVPAINAVNVQYQLQFKLLQLQAQQQQLLGIRKAQGGFEEVAIEGLRARALTGANNVSVSGLTNTGQIEFDKQQKLLISRINQGFDVKKIAEKFQSELGAIATLIGQETFVEGDFTRVLDDLFKGGDINKVIAKASEEISNFGEVNETQGASLKKAFEDLRYEVQGAGLNFNKASEAILSEATSAATKAKQQENVAIGKAVFDNYSSLKTLVSNFRKSPFAVNRLTSGVELARELPGFAQTRAGQGVRRDFEVDLRSKLLDLNKGGRDVVNANEIENIIKSSANDLFPIESLSEKFSKLVDLTTELPENLATVLKSPLADGMKAAIVSLNIKDTAQILKDYGRYFEITATYQTSALTYYQTMVDLLKANQEKRTLENTDTTISLIKSSIEKYLEINKDVLKDIIPDRFFAAPAWDFVNGGSTDVNSSGLPNGTFRNNLGETFKDNTIEGLSAEVGGGVLRNIGKAVKSGKIKGNASEISNFIKTDASTKDLTSSVTKGNIKAGEEVADAIINYLSKKGAVGTSEFNSSIDKKGNEVLTKNENFIELNKQIPAYAEQLAHLGITTERLNLAFGSEGGLITLFAEIEESSEKALVKLEVGIKALEEEAKKGAEKTKDLLEKNNIIIAAELKAAEDEKKGVSKDILKSLDITPALLKLSPEDLATEVSQANESSPTDIIPGVGEPLYELKRALQAVSKETVSVSGFMDNLAGTMHNALSQSIFDVITGAKSGSEAMRDFAKAILESLTQSVSDSIASGIISAAVAVFSANKGGKVPSIRGYAGGDVVSGGSGTKDDVLAMLTSGEFVMRRSAVQKYGTGTLKAMNEGRLRGMSVGGSVTNVNRGSSMGNSVSNQVAININIDSKGDVKETSSNSNQSQGQNQNQLDQTRELSRNIRSAVIEVLIDQRRNGGVLR